MSHSSSHSSPTSLTRAVLIGIGVSVLTAAFAMVLAAKGISPFPKPPSLAFAETILGRDVPLPVGLLFHLAYVTFWCVMFLRFSPSRSFVAALALGAALWVVVLVVFFPLIGWGLAGSAIGSKLIPASAMPHILFALFLWALNRFLPGA